MKYSLFEKIQDKNTEKPCYVCQDVVLPRLPISTR